MRIDLTMSLYGMSCMTSVLVLDFVTLGFFLLLRSSLRLELMLLVVGISQLGSSLLTLDPLNPELTLFMRSFAWLGSVPLVFGVSYPESFSLAPDYVCSDSFLLLQSFC